MQIIIITIGGALSRLASQQQASQENWLNLLNRKKVLTKSCYVYGALVCLLYWENMRLNYRPEQIFFSAH